MFGRWKFKSNSMAPHGNINIANIEFTRNTLKLSIQSEERSAILADSPMLHIQMKYLAILHAETFFFVNVLPVFEFIISCHGF